MDSGAERRRSERLPCRLRCQVEIPDLAKAVEGLVRNLSAGGLGLQVAAHVRQGDELKILIHGEGRRSAVEVEAICWHVREVRDRRSGEKAQRLGLVLSSAEDDFMDLLDSLRGPTHGASRSGRESDGPTEVSVDPVARECESAPAGSSPDPDAPRLDDRPVPSAKRFRVQVQKEASPRTRGIMVFAGSDVEAREQALVEVGSGWLVLSVAAA